MSDAKITVEINGARYGFTLEAQAIGDANRKKLAANIGEQIVDRIYNEVEK